MIPLIFAYNITPVLYKMFIRTFRNNLRIKTNIKSLTLSYKLYTHWRKPCITANFVGLPSQLRNLEKFSMRKGEHYDQATIANK